MLRSMILHAILSTIDAITKRSDNGSQADCSGEAHEQEKQKYRQVNSFSENATRDERKPEKAAGCAGGPA